MVLILAAVGCCAPRAVPSPRVQLDGASCVLSAHQPRPESTCDHRDLVDLDCSNPMVPFDRAQAAGEPQYCFGLRLSRADAAPLLRDSMPGDLCR